MVSGARVAVTVPNVSVSCSAHATVPSRRTVLGSRRDARRESGCSHIAARHPIQKTPRMVLPSPGTSTSMHETPIIGTMTVSEVGRSMPAPSGPERRTCVPDSSQATNVAVAPVCHRKTSGKASICKSALRMRRRGCEKWCSGLHAFACRKRNDVDRFHPGGRVLRSGIAGCVLPQIQPGAGGAVALRG